MIHAKVIVMKISKCKKELARIISDNGGWPERALWAVQDNCIAFFLGGRPEYKSGDRCWYSNCLDGACVGTITRDEKVTNWHQTILSREEYFHLYPSPDADGWIEWKGGECPVGGDVMVVCKVRTGKEFRNGKKIKASILRWRHTGGMADIIAYRLHKPEQSKPEFCESVMRSIPETIAKPTIEQLAADYRNAKDYAERKQQEADAAKADADAKLKALELAGEAIGLLVSPIAEKQKSELVIAVQVGDEVECVESNIKRDKYNGMVGRMHFIDESDTSTPYLVDFGGEAKIWCHEVKFIRRP